LVVYGTLAGGCLYHLNYRKNYNSYTVEENTVKRINLFNQAQKQVEISRALIYSAASVWAVNVIWIALAPDRYQPLQHAKVSLDLLPGPNGGSSVLSLRLDF